MDAFVDKRLVASHFDLHAGDYDSVTPVQAAMAEAVLGRVRASCGDRQPGRILELGCGTGRLTRLLRGAYPASAITSLDVAAGMVEAARRKLAGEPVRWLVGDAEELPPEARGGAPYDLVVSNAMIQWLQQPGEMLAEWGSLLAPEGRLVVSTFGPETFRELRASFVAAEKALGLKPGEHLMRLPSADDLGDWLREAGLTARVEREVEVRAYPGVREFLHSLKLTGATSARSDMAPVGKALYRRLLTEYASRFPHVAGGVAVTYEKLYAVAGR